MEYVKKQPPIARHVPTVFFVWCTGTLAG